MSLAMTHPEREAFLADLHVAVLGVADGDRGPLALPIWYAYEPGGEVWIVTGRGSRKAVLLEGARRFSLCVQTETPPYRYVSVEGPVSGTEPADVEKHIRPLAHRYLGAEMGDRYVAATATDSDGGENVLFRMRPERWRTVDYSKEFQSL